MELIVSWASSPASVVKIKCIVIDLSSLHCEVDTEMWSAIMASSPLPSSIHLSSSLKVLRQPTACRNFLTAANNCEHVHNVGGKTTARAAIRVLTPSAIALFYLPNPYRMRAFGCPACSVRIDSKSLQGWSVPDTPRMHWPLLVGGVCRPLHCDR